MYSMEKDKALMKVPSDINKQADLQDKKIIFNYDTRREETMPDETQNKVDESLTSGSSQYKNYLDNCNNEYQESPIVKNRESYQQNNNQSYVHSDCTPSNVTNDQNQTDQYQDHN